MYLLFYLWFHILHTLFCALIIAESLVQLACDPRKPNQNCTYTPSAWSLLMLAWFSYFICWTLMCLYWLSVDRMLRTAASTTEVNIAGAGRSQRRCAAGAVVAMGLSILVPNAILITLWLQGHEEAKGGHEAISSRMVLWHSILFLCQSVGWTLLCVSVAVITCQLFRTISRVMGGCAKVVRNTKALLKVVSTAAVAGALLCSPVSFYWTMRASQDFRACRTDEFVANYRLSWWLGVVTATYFPIAVFMFIMWDRPKMFVKQLDDSGRGGLLGSPGSSSGRGPAMIASGGDGTVDTHGSGEGLDRSLLNSFSDRDG